MNIGEILAKMDSKMLSEGLLKITKGLSPEELKQAEKVIKDSGAVSGLDSAKFDSVEAMLKQNPNILKSLANNPELVSKIQKIIKK